MIPTLIIYDSIILIYHAISALLATIYHFGRWQGLVGERYPSPPATPPLVSVVIPARNEEDNIGPCLEAVLRQDYPRFEVIVLDDGSEDCTAAVAAEIAAGDPRVRILPADPRPPGWFGKPWALHCAQREARGEYLLFLDADVQVAPHNLRHALSHALAERLDMLSLMGTLTVKGFWEGAIQPIMGYVIVAFFPLDRVNSPRSRIVMCNGQYILIRAEAYERAGGHEAIRGAILEDVELARRVKGSGLRYRLLMAPGEFSCRMYSRLGEIWEGWSKNFYAAMRFNPLRAAIALVLLFFVSLYPLLDAAARLGLGEPDPLILGFSVAAGASVLLLRLYVSMLFRFPLLHTLTHPLGVAVVIGIMINSIWKGHAHRQVTWKGRSYTVR